MMERPVNQATNNEVFEYVNKDLSLLFLVIFLELSKEKKILWKLTDFFKGDYWGIDDVRDEIFDTNDYRAVADMVLEQLIFVFEELKIGKILRVGIDDPDDALRDLLIQVAKIGPKDIELSVSNYIEPVQQLSFLESLRQERIQKAPDDDEAAKEDLLALIRDRSILFSRDEGYFGKVQPLVIFIPEHVVIEVEFSQKRMAPLESEIRAYLENWAADKYVETRPLYRASRPYFVQQFESFYRYISRLQLVGDMASVPFGILTEPGFEAVKMLRYFESKGVLSIRWSDEGSWRVKFRTVPITAESLLGTPKPATDASEASRGLKADLSFDYVSSVLRIGEYQIKIKGPDQKELLKILFEEDERLDREWFFSEISEKYDHADILSDKKFYNAAYQVNLKIARNTPIKDFLITTKQTVKINPLYLKV